MKILTAIMKSLTAAMLVGFYLFSGTSAASGTCGIGYIDVLLLREPATGGSGQTGIEVSVDNTGFLSPSLTPAHNMPDIHNKKTISILWESGDVNSLVWNKFNQYVGLLKMAQVARLPARIHTTGDDCIGGADEFQIYVCMNENDCNVQ